MVNKSFLPGDSPMRSDQALAPIGQDTHLQDEMESCLWIYVFNIGRCSSVTRNEGTSTPDAMPLSCANSRSAACAAGTAASREYRVCPSRQTPADPAPP